MFENRLKEISKKIGEEKTEIFHILTHKRTKREVYFKNNSNTIKFIKIKFKNSLKKDKFRKKFAYFLIKLRLLQPFLRKIKLSSKLGDVIFVGGQIKGFDLSRKEVISFPLYEDQKKDFLEQKKFQKNIAKKGFAPNVVEINKNIPFSREELLTKYNGGRDIDVFRKLLEYYKQNKVQEIALEDYLKRLEKRLGKHKKDILIKKVFGIIKRNYPEDTKLKITQIHGDFSREQILIKKNLPVFVDWNPHENLIATDLIKFFREETNFDEIPALKYILGLYPKDIRENLNLYILLDDVEDFIKRKRLNKIPKKRIENVLNGKYKKKRE